MLGSAAVTVLVAGHVLNSVAFDWPFLNLNAEQNLPTWMSSLGFACAGLAWLAAGFGNAPPQRAWAALGVLMLALSLDDVAMIHEYLEDVGNERAMLLVIEPALALMIVASFAATARTLPRPSRQLLWSGLMALIVAQLASSSGFLAEGGTLSTAALAAVEESSEMMMAVLVLSAAVEPLGVVTLRDSGRPNPRSPVDRV